MLNSSTSKVKDKIDATIDNKQYAIVERFGKQYAIKVKSSIDKKPESYSFAGGKWEICETSLYTWACLHCEFVKYVNVLK